jgi:hypothetical protein
MNRRSIWPVVPRALITLLDPTDSYANIAYVGYGACLAQLLLSQLPRKIRVDAK